jgi:hypothetical protein
MGFYGPGVGERATIGAAPRHIHVARVHHELTNLDHHTVVIPYSLAVELATPFGTPSLRRIACALKFGAAVCECRSDGTMVSSIFIISWLPSHVLLCTVTICIALDDQI